MLVDGSVDGRGAASVALDLICQPGESVRKAVWKEFISPLDSIYLR